MSCGVLNHAISRSTWDIGEGISCMADGMLWTSLTRLTKRTPVSKQLDCNNGRFSLLQKLHETPWNSYLEEHHINGFSDASYRWNLMDLFCPSLGYLFIIQFPSLTVMNFRFICPWRFNPGRGGRGFRLGLWVTWRPPSDSMDGLDLTSIGQVALSWFEVC